MGDINAPTAGSSGSRFQDNFAALPVAHKVMVAGTVVVLGLVGFLFFQWVSSPSWSVLATDLSDTELGAITTELDSNGVAYRLDGSRLFVERGDLTSARTGLARAGVNTGSDGGGVGYEILDNTGFSVNDSVLQINSRRALEGEIARTLRSLDRIAAATVHLAVPESSLFSEPGAAEAAVTIDVPSDFGSSEVAAVQALVAAAVPNLEAVAVTVVDLQGRALASPADAGTGGALEVRNLRRTREVEEQLESDLIRMLISAGAGDRSTVVVQALFNFDEVTVRSETFDDESQIAIRESAKSEQLTGAQAEQAAGIPGVDGGPVNGELTDGGVVNVDDSTGDITYLNTESVTEYRVDSVVSNIVQASGTLIELHVGVVIDDGSVTGASVPSVQTVQALVSSTLGINPDRGDTLAVTAVPFPSLADAEPLSIPVSTSQAAESSALTDYIPQAVGGVVLLLVVAGLIAMLGKDTESPAIPDAELAAVPVAPALGPRADDRAVQVHDEVVQLVQRQPEEIATLLRGWLAER